jgi:hypothetical protein
MLRLPQLKPRNWLIVFVKDRLEDGRAVKNLVKRLEESLSKKSMPFSIEHLALNDDERKILKLAGAEKDVEWGAEERLNEVLINKIIDLKKKARPKPQRVAVVLSRSDIGSDEAFLAAVSDSLISNEPYYVICWWTNFLSLSRKLDCLDLQCGACSIAPIICEHSCLTKLLWLLFNKNETVKDEIQKIVEIHKEFE